MAQIRQTGEITGDVVIISLKKLILFFPALLLGVMSSGARADTSYNFSYSSDGGSFYTITNGTFSVNSSNIVTAITGTVGGTVGTGNGNITGLYAVQTWQGNDNVMNYGSGSPYFTRSGGVSFYTNGLANNANSFQLYSNGSLPTLYAGGNGLSYPSGGGSGVFTVTPSGAAPEIDGALIPQVGLLLACLYLIFGRKKQDTEIILAA